MENLNGVKRKKLNLKLNKKVKKLKLVNKNKK